MTTNSLKLNEEKTEFIVFKPKNTILDTQQLTISGNIIKESEHVKILGVTFDNNMTMQKHITNTCRSANIYIRKIRSIRRYLTIDAVRTLVQAVVISRLDYCNSLLIGLPLNRIRTLQVTQNSAARVISRLPRYSHITDTMRMLHWLPIDRRCQFKVLVMTYKAMQGSVPLYIAELLQWYTPTRTLRSSSIPSLVPTRHRTILIGRRIMDTSAATLWNNLPTDIKCASNLQTFKGYLKTFLFPS